MDDIFHGVPVHWFTVRVVVGWGRGVLLLSNNNGRTYASNEMRI